MTQEINPMEHTEEQEQQKPIIIGQLLREAREQLGLSTREVAERLCLRNQVVRQIEENHFDETIAPTFMRGYLKSYASLVDLDETYILQAYKEYLDAIAKNKPEEELRSYSYKKQQETEDNRVMIVTWVVGVVIVFSVVVFLWQRWPLIRTMGQQQATKLQQHFPSSESRTGIPSSISYANRLVGTDTDTLEEHKEDAGDKDKLSAEQDRIQAVDESGQEKIQDQALVEREEESSEHEASHVATEHASEKPQTDEEVASEESAEALNAVELDVSQYRTGEYLDEVDPNAGELVFYFHGDSWVDVRDANDEEQVLAYGVKKTGYNMPLYGVSSYKIVIGSPHNVSLYYHGEKVDLTSFPSGHTARFTIP